MKISLSSKKYGAYKCWTTGCTSKQIKEALGIKSVIQPTHQISRLKSSPITPLPQVSPVVFNGTSFCGLKKHTPIPVTTKYQYSVDHDEILKVHRRIYPYSDTQRLLRWDIEGSTFRQKRPCVQTKDPFGEWCNGVVHATNTWPVYQGNSEPADNGDTALFVEGEKTAEYIKDFFNIFAATLSGITFNSDPMKITLTLRVFFSKYPFIKNILYVPDSDEPGMKKAHTLEKPVWLSSRGYIIRPLESFIPKSVLLTQALQKGLDLADFNPEQINLVKLLC